MPPLLLVFAIFLLAHPSLQADGSGSVVMLKRKYVGNVPDYFNKNFADYKAGFESRGELWLGLDKLHQLTSQGSYGLHITLKDWDDKTYVAVYDQFEVGPGCGYMLTVAGFSRTLSTLGDAMAAPSDSSHNGMKFSTKDLDQAPGLPNCALSRTGGWWYSQACGVAHLTGRHTESRTRIDAWKQIYYRHGGDRVHPNSSGDHSFDSWKEAQMTLVATTTDGNPWLSSGRCGSEHFLQDGRPGQCDPNASANNVGPCCSNQGWCGNSPAHCDCAGCVDYRPGGAIAEPESPITTTGGDVTSVENDTFLYVVIALAVLSGVLLLLLIGVVYLIYKMWSTARNAIKKDVNPLYGIEYEDAEAKGKNEETKGKNDNPRSKSVDQHYDYMGS